MMLILSVCVVSALMHLASAKMLHGTVRGWNSWDAVGLNGNESFVYQAAEFLTESGLQSKGYTWITNDAGWYGAGAPIDPFSVSIDEYGRLRPSKERFPSLGGSFAPLSSNLEKKGFNFGHWLIRGIPVRAVAERTPIKGTNYTAADVARFDRNCTWSGLNVGVNASHPAAQAWYDSVVELAAESGVALLKWDCLFAKDLVADELELIARAVRGSEASIVLSLSPGQDEVPSLGKWVNDNELATFYRVDGDFWDVGPGINPGWGQLWTHVHTAWANANAGVRNNDLDMLPVGAIGCGSAVPPCRQSRFPIEQQRTIMALWGITGSPLIWGGVPEAVATSNETLELLGNEELLRMHEASADGEGGLLTLGSSSTEQVLRDGGEHSGRYTLKAVNVTVIGSDGVTSGGMNSQDMAAFVLFSSSSQPAWVLVSSGRAGSVQFEASWSQLGIEVATGACAEVSSIWSEQKSKQCSKLSGTVAPYASEALRLEFEV